MTEISSNCCNNYPIAAGSISPKLPFSAQAQGPGYGENAFTHQDTCE